MKISDWFQYTYRDIPSLTYGLIIVSALALGVAISLNDEDDTDDIGTTDGSTSVISSVTKSATKYAEEVADGVSTGANSVAETFGMSPPPSSNSQQTPQLGGKQHKSNKRTKKRVRTKK